MLRCHCYDVDEWRRVTCVGFADGKNPCISTWHYDSIGRLARAVSDNVALKKLDSAVPSPIQLLEAKIGINRQSPNLIFLNPIDFHAAS